MALPDYRKKSKIKKIVKRYNDLSLFLFIMLLKNGNLTRIIKHSIIKKPLKGHLQ